MGISTLKWPGVAADSLLRFVHSHHLHGGLRQALGVLLPAVLLGLLSGSIETGFVMAVGALCVAILDQPGGPRRYGVNGMLAALCLGSLTAIVTGLAAASHVVLLWLAVTAFSFAYSMLGVYGKNGGLLGFACLLIMTLTMRGELAPDEVLRHTAISFCGGLIYLAFSMLWYRVRWYREVQQVLASALLATADYMRIRARLYDGGVDLEHAYRALLRSQAQMIDAHQAARDMVLREQPGAKPGRANQRRAELLDIFMDMVDLLDGLVATHTDYATLRAGLANTDTLLFMRDALTKLADNLAGVALQLARNRHARVRNSVRAELRALEFDLQQFRAHARDKPELYALMVQVLRRLRTMARLVDRMASCASRAGDAPQADPQRAQKSLDRFLQRQKWRWGQVGSNLHMDSAHFRYALRVSVAVLLAMATGQLLALLPLGAGGDGERLAGHGYWIVLTVLIIMKPGFALTRQRNAWRLSGTLIGCALAMLLFASVQSPLIYLALMLVCSVLGFALVQLNYTLSAMCNTMLVLLTFHFLLPGAHAVVGERLLDTLLGCALAMACSYILPSREHDGLRALAQKLLQANQTFLQQGLSYAACRRQQGAGASEAETTWRLSRKNVHIAFSNFAAAFYRMLDEPARWQRHLPELNLLLTQHHTLASQTAAVVPLLAQLPDEPPPGISELLAATSSQLHGGEQKAPATTETGGQFAALAYPLRQMARAAEQINAAMRVI